MKLINVIKNPDAYAKRALIKSKNFFRSIFYKGDKVVCETCNWNGTTFFDQKCPKCNSLPRTRLVPFSIKYFELDKNNPKILHIAPNINEYDYIKREVTDISNYDRLNIREVPHINLVQDLTQTTLEDNIYDLAIAWHVLEHIPQDLKAISEVYRVLKPGGKFLISVPIYPTGNKNTYEDTSIPYKDYEKIHGHYDHCRSCGLDYYKRFETVGFKTETLVVETLNTEDKERYGLRNDHVVWSFTK